MAEETDMSADPVDRRPQDRRKGNILVAAQFGLLAVAVLPFGPGVTMPGWAVGVGMAIWALALGVGVAGLVALGASTRINPVPGEGIRLRTSGIYAYIRHPMYVAVMLLAIGSTLVNGRVLALLATCALAVVLWVKARFEEDLLTEQFGWEYSAYAARVPAVVPRIARIW